MTLSSPPPAPDELERQLGVVLDGSDGFAALWASLLDLPGAEDIIIPPPRAPRIIAIGDLLHREGVESPVIDLPVLDPMDYPDNRQARRADRTRAEKLAHQRRRRIG